MVQCAELSCNSDLVLSTQWAASEESETMVVWKVASSNNIRSVLEY